MTAEEAMEAKLAALGLSVDTTGMSPSEVMNTQLAALGVSVDTSGMSPSAVADTQLAALGLSVDTSGMTAEEAMNAKLAALGLSVDTSGMSVSEVVDAHLAALDSLVDISSMPSPEAVDTTGMSPSAAAEAHLAAVGVSVDTSGLSPEAAMDAQVEALAAAQGPAVQDSLGKRECVLPEVEQEQQLSQEQEAPAIDFLLNPARATELRSVTQKMQDVAKNYFETSDMATLYPELFRLLWQSTLPCFTEEGVGENLLRQCQLGSQQVLRQTHSGHDLKHIFFCILKR